MDGAAAPSGRTIGWAVGGTGLVVTLVLGTFIEAGVGFTVLALLFWTLIGGLFGFLSERARTQEEDATGEHPRIVFTRPAGAPDPTRSRSGRRKA